MSTSNRQPDIYTAENWRPLIEHTICRSRPQVIRQYGFPPSPSLPAYFAFVQRALHPIAVCCFSRAPPHGAGPGFELGINTLSVSLHCGISVGVCYDVSHTQTEFYQSPIKATIVSVNVRIKKKIRRIFDIKCFFLIEEKV